MPWRDRVNAELAAMDANKIVELAGRAPVDAVSDPHATAVFLDRLARRGDDEATRAAVAQALPKTSGQYVDAIPDLLADEPSVAVRVALIAIARQVPPGEQAYAILRRGFADANVQVRVEAARSASAHAGCERLAAELRTALTDGDAALRVEAAKSLGVLKVQPAREDLVKALSDGSPDVRLEAMRALDQIAPGSLAGTTQVVALQNDADERVSALAKKLSVRQQ
jgi:HEAT repeat protein